MRSLREQMETGGFDTILGSQCYTSHPLSQMGEYRLLISVLEQALRDLNARGTESKHAYTLNDEALAWFHDDTPHAFSLREICHIAGLDADKVRAYATSVAAPNFKVRRGGYKRSPGMSTRPR